MFSKIATNIFRIVFFDEHTLQFILYYLDTMNASQILSVNTINPVHKIPPRGGVVRHGGAVMSGFTDGDENLVFCSKNSSRIFRSWIKNRPPCQDSFSFNYSCIILFPSKYLL